MPRARRLHLDDVITSMPELGPTIPDGGYSWLILFGTVAIQITVPSVLSVYGVVLGYLASDSNPDIYLWNGSITLTPILFAAFWSLADPWSRTIVGLASIPRLVGLIGVALLAIGVLASGYLATGGVGAYLARLSAGAVMGIGTSLILVQSENMLRRHFRTKLVLVLTLRNIAYSFGLVFAPGFSYILLENAGLQKGLLLLATIFIPAALGALTFRVPTLQKSTKYTLLLSEEDNELTIRDTPDVTRGTPQNEATRDNEFYTDAEVTGEGPPPLFNEGSHSYAYEDLEDDVNLFVTPIARSRTSWKDEFQILRLAKFWAAVAAWIGMKAGALSLWVLLPPLLLSSLTRSFTLADAVMLSVVAGSGTMAPSIASYWAPKTARCRSIYFGGMCWLGSMSLLGLAYSSEQGWLMMFSLMGGAGIGGALIGQESALRDVLGAEAANRAHTALSIFVGFSLLLLSFIQSFSVCLRFTATAQFVGGSYWILTPLIGAIRARWPR